MDQGKSKAKKFIKKVAIQVQQQQGLTDKDIKIINIFQTIVSQLPQGNIKKSIESDLESFYDIFVTSIKANSDNSNKKVSKNHDHPNQTSSSSSSSIQDSFQFSWKVQMLNQFVSLYENQEVNSKVDSSSLLLSSVVSGEHYLVANALVSLSTTQIRNISSESRQILSNFIRLLPNNSSSISTATNDDGYLSSTVIQAYLLAYDGVMTCTSETNVCAISAVTATVASTIIANKSIPFLYMYSCFVGIWLCELGYENNNNNTLDALLSQLLRLWAAMTKSTVPTSSIRPLLINGFITLHAELTTIAASKEMPLKAKANTLRAVIAEQIQRLVSIHSDNIGDSNKTNTSLLVWRDIVQPVLLEFESAAASVVCPLDSASVNANLLTWFVGNKPYRDASIARFKSAVKNACEQYFPVKNAEDESAVKTASNQHSKGTDKESSYFDVERDEEEEEDEEDEEYDDTAALFSLDTVGDGRTEQSACVDEMMQELAAVTAAVTTTENYPPVSKRSSRTRSGSDLSIASSSSSTAPEKRTRTRTRSGSDASVASEVVQFDKRVRGSKQKLEPIIETPKSKAKKSVGKKK